MSVQFAKDEKVIKSFNYAAVGYNKKKGRPDTFKSLIVTNKRVIHEAVREKRSNELIIRQEMPVADAKYVKTTMGKSSNPALLVQAIVFFAIAALLIVVSTLDFAEKFPFVFWALAAPFVVLGIVKLVGYFSSINAVVSFGIYTDHIITPVMNFAAVENSEANADDDDQYGKKSKKKEPSLEIRVNTDIAREIADGLGAAILDAIAYTEEKEEAVIAPADTFERRSAESKTKATEFMASNDGMTFHEELAQEHPEDLGEMLIDETLPVAEAMDVAEDTEI